MRSSATASARRPQSTGSATCRSASRASRSPSRLRTERRRSPARARSSTASRPRLRSGRRRSRVTTPAGSRERDPNLRRLPAVERVAARLDGIPHPIAVAAARRAIDCFRQRLVDGDSVDMAALEREAAASAADMLKSSLRRVINATGVIVHTNLGRAPLADQAVEAVAEASGYSNLEYELESGRRGSRQGHVEGLLTGLTGAEAALCVNNGAAAVLLAAAALAAGREVVISRGQLVEIGGSFRIPEVVAQSGARLVEVGTTNRTRLADYERAVSEATGAILRVHQSNFRTLGFVEDVAIEDLCRLEVPVVDDLGSGALVEIADEPQVRRSVAAGCAIVCFSADKLLGGPQAGVMVGTRAAIALSREHPLARAVRIDKLSLAALEATLRLYRDGKADGVPVLRMLNSPEEELRVRAERMAAKIPGASVVAGTARVG